MTPTNRRKRRQQKWHEGTPIEIDEDDDTTLPDWIGGCVNRDPNAKPKE